MIKIGVIGTPGGWSSELLADTLEKKTGYRKLISLDGVCLDLKTGKGWFQGTDLSSLDALIVKKAGTRYSPALLDRLEMLRSLHDKGLKIYSNPLNIIRVLNRLSCTVTLDSAGIPMPPTTITEDVEAAVEAVENYGEAVFKPLFSTKARGMVVMRPCKDLKKLVEDFTIEHGIMYIQKKLDLGGQDLGIAFLGGEYLATYARCNNGSSWNTTTRSGGKYKPFTPCDSTIELAGKAQALFGLDFTCVDVANTKEGAVVFEVSAFGGFRGLQTANGLDAADLFVDYVLNKVKTS